MPPFSTNRISFKITVVDVLVMLVLLISAGATASLSLIPFCSLSMEWFLQFALESCFIPGTEPLAAVGFIMLGIFDEIFYVLPIVLVLVSIGCIWYWFRKYQINSNAKISNKIILWLLILISTASALSSFFVGIYLILNA